MKKKIVLSLLLAAFVAGGAFAQFGMSAGGGALFDFSGNNGVKYTGDSSAMKGFNMGSRNTSIGAFAFFDATYAEVSAYFAYGSMSNYASGKMMGSDVKLSDDDKKGGSVLQLGFSLLGKFPIDMDGVTIFPMLGMDYNIVLSGKGPDKKDLPNAGDFSQLGILGGIGGDIKISGPLFIRLEALLHLRIPTEKMRESVKNDDDMKATWGFGPQIKAAIGYKF